MLMHNALRASLLAAVSLAGCASDPSDAGFKASTQSTQGSAGQPAAASPAVAGAGAADAARARGTSPGSAAVGGSPARAGTLADPGTNSPGLGSAGRGGAGSAVASSVAGAGGAIAAVGGSGGSAGASAGSATAAGASADSGKCCPDGDCLCHGPAPTELSITNGTYKTERATISSGTLHYPTDAEPPFAAVALCAGFLNTGPEMEAWGPMYASYGIVTVIVTTDGADIPDIRATRLLAAIDELKKLNGDSTSPIANKLSGRFGTSGYSMGGGGTTIASGQSPELKSSVGLAAWGGSAMGVKVPTLLLCGDADTVAACNMSQPVYDGIGDDTPKMMITIPGVTHFDWFGPADAGRGISGMYALAFQKVFLEGDTRWKSLLIAQPPSGSLVTNIK